jgi:hypothetical protein
MILLMLLVDAEGGSEIIGCGGKLVARGGRDSFTLTSREQVAGAASAAASERLGTVKDVFHSAAFIVVSRARSGKRAENMFGDMI